MRLMELGNEFLRDVTLDLDIVDSYNRLISELMDYDFTSCISYLEYNKLLNDVKKFEKLTMLYLDGYIERYYYLVISCGFINMLNFKLEGLIWPGILIGDA